MAGVLPDGAAARLRRFGAAQEEAGCGGAYETAHARLVLDAARAAAEHKRLRDAGEAPELAEESARAAIAQYENAALRLWQGLEKTLDGYSEAEEPMRKAAFSAWKKSRD